MAKQKKQPRPKAQTPKGFRDYFANEVTERTEMLSKIAGVYHRYGFDALESAAVETVEALGKFQSVETTCGHHALEAAFTGLFKHDPGELVVGSLYD